MGRFTSLRTRSARVLTSRLTFALAASGATALILGSVSFGTATQTTALDGQVLDGNVQLVDATETTSYIGLGGFTHTVPGTPKSQSTIPIGGTLSSFNGVTGLFATGTFTFTVFVNNAATPITCTVTAPART